MPLPSVIEIVPLPKPVSAEVVVPGSKSITNRALILAVLAGGTTILDGALWSEDTQVMVKALRVLGFRIEAQPDPEEIGNRRIIVHGGGGEIPPGGSEHTPLELFVQNAGTAARFLAALVCLGNGAYRLHGVPRMHERPQAALFRALRELGYRIDTPNEKLPAVIHGGGPRKARTTVSITESSQFASALLLVGRTGGWEVRITGENAEESPYVALTLDLIRRFPQSGQFQIEPDASSASYIWGAEWLINHFAGPERIAVADWPAESLQIDAQFPELIRKFPGRISRLLDLGDSIMTAIGLAPLAEQPKEFTDLGRLRLQECERVIALRTELQKCGAAVVEEGDTLKIQPGKLHGAEIETYNDHRMAMVFATLGLKIPGLKINNPSCVKKTFPNFFQKLALPPPAGLGTVIVDSHTGARLQPRELMAE